LPEGSVREIIQDVPGLYKKLERVTVEFPSDTSTPTEWKDLAEELSTLAQVLCIVSDRKSCRELHALMPDGTYHLSALMCAEHRTNIIKEIENKLKKKESVRVISTQLVEAGVDIDFPVVYRSIAGIDSIAQAAGRCNREGKLDGKGKVIVFKPPRKAPAGMLRKAAEITEGMILKDGIADIMDRNVYASYFSELFWKANSLDSEDIMKRLRYDSGDIEFRSVSESFKIIDDGKQRSIIVRYGESEKLVDLLKIKTIPASGILRKLQRFTVNVYANQFYEMERRGSLEQVFPGVFALNNDIEYCDKKGLLIAEEMRDAKDFVI
jgi:CRISPR-associated endonuclease/helicase Cas3